MISNANPKPERQSDDVTTSDAFLGGRIDIVQPRSGHRGGSDAVFLAAAVAAKSGDHVLDAGAGAGTAGLCVLARVPGANVTAVEIDDKQCERARDNAAHNGFADRYEAIAADLTAPLKMLTDVGLRREGYDHVIANPPFYSHGSVRVAPDAARAAAHVMTDGELERWIRFLTTFAAPKGTLTIIHLAEHLGMLLDLLRDRFGNLAVYPLFPRDGVPATRIIVQGHKNSRAKIRLLPGLVLHDEACAYTREAEAVLRNGAALSLR